MASAQDFIDRISRIKGVDSCLLVKNDGTLLGKTCDNSDVFSALMMISSNLAGEVSQRTGFSQCRHLSFRCEDDLQFYVFPIDSYQLGVIQEEGRNVPEMLDEIYRLIGRVSTKKSEQQADI